MHTKIAIMAIRVLTKQFFPPVSASFNRTVTQSPIMGTPRIINAIKQDHREIESYYDRITKSNDKNEQTQYQNLFTWELARHSIGEELVVYPAFEKHIKDGVALADKDRKEHQSVSPTFTLSSIKTNAEANARTARKTGKRTAQKVPKPQTHRPNLPPDNPIPNERPLPAHPRRRNFRPAPTRSRAVR